MRALLVPVVAAAVVCGCGGAPGDADARPTAPRTTVDPPRLARMAVVLDPTTVEVGRTGAARAGGVDQHGDAIALGDVTWASSSPGVATIASTGAIAALAPGTALISGTSAGVSASATLVVTALANPPQTLRVVPASASLTAGTSMQLGAVLVTAQGDTLTTPPVAWTSTNPDVAAVSAAGVLRALKPGIAVVRAAAGALVGEAPVLVSAVVDPAMEVHFVSPSYEGSIVGDTVRIVVTVTSWQHIARADARIDNDAPVNLARVRLGAMGGVEGWALAISLIATPIGAHRVVVTAHGDNDAIAVGTIGFTREVPQSGGTLPVGGHKLVRPPTPPIVPQAGASTPAVRPPRGPSR